MALCNHSFFLSPKIPQADLRKLVKIVRKHGGRLCSLSAGGNSTDDDDHNSNKNNGTNLPLQQDQHACFHKECYHVLPSFEDQDFRELYRKGLKLLGPPCLFSLSEEEGISPAASFTPSPPFFLHDSHSNNTNQQQPCPRFGTWLRGVVLCCTGLEQALQDRLHQMVSFAGGSFHRDLTNTVTHLVALRVVESQKYKMAARLGTPLITTPQWLMRCWRERRLLPAEDFALSCFAGCVIAVTGLRTALRERVERLCWTHGAVYCRDLTRTCTHLLAEKPEGKKYYFARQWGVKVVYPAWFEECLSRKVCVDEEPYELPQTEPETEVPAPSQPEHGKHVATSDFNTSLFGTLPTESSSAIPSKRKVGTVERKPNADDDSKRVGAKEDEEEGEENSVASSQPPSKRPRRSSLASSMASDPTFNKTNGNDGEATKGSARRHRGPTPGIGLSACSPQSLSAASQSSTGTTVLASNEVAFMSSCYPIFSNKETNSDGCHSLDSFSEPQQHQATMNMTMTYSNDSYRSPSIASAVCGDGVTYSGESPSIEDSMSYFPYELSSLFQGIAFLVPFAAYSSLQQERLYRKCVDCIEKYGGLVLQDGGQTPPVSYISSIVVTYMLCPHGYVPPNTDSCSITAPTPIVTPEWLFRCVEEEKRLEPGEFSFLFTPQAFPLSLKAARAEQEATDGKQCLLCISGFVGEERTNVIALIHAAEMPYAERLSRRQTTHLICKEASFSSKKYAKALRWKTSAVVSLDWLLESIRHNAILPTDSFKLPFLQDDSKLLSSSQQQNTERKSSLATSHNIRRRVPSVAQEPTIASLVDKKMVGPILPEVTIYVSNRLTKERQELHDMVAALGGFQAFGFDDSVTHFICEGKPDNTREFRLARNKKDVYIVSPIWLRECYRQNTHLPECDYPFTLNPRMNLGVGVVSVSTGIGNPLIYPSVSVTTCSTSTDEKEKKHRKKKRESSAQIPKGSKSASVQYVDDATNWMKQSNGNKVGPPDDGTFVFNPPPAIIADTRAIHEDEEADKEKEKEKETETETETEKGKEKEKEKENEDEKEKANENENEKEKETAQLRTEAKQANEKDIREHEEDKGSGELIPMEEEEEERKSENNNDEEEVADARKIAKSEEDEKHEVTVSSLLLQQCQMLLKKTTSRWKITRLNSTKRINSRGGGALAAPSNRTAEWISRHEMQQAATQLSPKSKSGSLNGANHNDMNRTVHNNRQPSYFSEQEPPDSQVVTYDNFVERRATEQLLMNLPNIATITHRTSTATVLDITEDGDDDNDDDEGANDEEERDDGGDDDHDDDENENKITEVRSATTSAQENSAGSILHSSKKGGTNESGSSRKTGSGRRPTPTGTTNAAVELPLGDDKNANDPSQATLRAKHPASYKFMLTSFAVAEKTTLMQQIQELGGLVLNKEVFDKNCTHVLMGAPARTEKSLAACAAGVWLLKETYIHASMEAGHFVDERAFIWTEEKSPHSQRELMRSYTYWQDRLRRERENFNPSNPPPPAAPLPPLSAPLHTGSDGRGNFGAFAGWAVVLLHHVPKRRDSLKRLIEAGGGQVLATKLSSNYVEPLLQRYHNNNNNDHQQRQLLVFVSRGHVDSHRALLQQLQQAKVLCISTDYIGYHLLPSPPPVQDYLIK